MRVVIDVEEFTDFTCEFRSLGFRPFDLEEGTLEPPPPDVTMG
jgi:hypothetical protein